MLRYDFMLNVLCSASERLVGCDKDWHSSNEWWNPTRLLDINFHGCFFHRVLTQRMICQYVVYTGLSLKQFEKLHLLQNVMARMLANEHLPKQVEHLTLTPTAVLWIYLRTQARCWFWAWQLRPKIPKRLPMARCWNSPMVACRLSSNHNRKPFTIVALRLWNFLICSSMASQ